jgi:hypothetical protein
MALSEETRRLLRAYDSFSDVVRCPDLLCSPDAYERLDDEVVQIMLRACCYTWAAGQLAAGVYAGSVTDLADELFDPLETWDARWPHRRKVEWVLALGVTSALLRSDQPAQDMAELSCADRDAVEDMAYFFQIAPREATLLFYLGRALGAPAQQAELGGALGQV